MSAMRCDAVVIGAGLGGLTAAALLAKAGRNVRLIERNHAIGGAASVFKFGDLTIEPSLHQTPDPRDPEEATHAVLERLGLLDEIEWISLPTFTAVEGGPVGERFDLPPGFGAAREALAKRFPRSAAGASALLDDIETTVRALSKLSAARDSRSLGPLLRGGRDIRGLVRDWRASLAEVMTRRLGSDEAAKLAIAGNIFYYADAPERLAWPFFAVAQGGFLRSGGVFVKGGSHALSMALAKIVNRSGGQVRLGREAVGVDLDAAGRPVAVRHVDAKSRGGEERIEAPLVLTNGAPQALAAMLEGRAATAMTQAYAGLPLSISLFSAHFGLVEPPSKFGLTRYNVMRLPSWMRSLADMGRCAELLAGDPGRAMPAYGLTNYGAIDSGLGDGQQTLVTAVGVDRAENWTSLTKDEEKRRREAWLDALQADIDRAYPGFGSAVKTRMFLNARSMQGFLGTPGGAVYGFAPTPFARGVWSGWPRSPQTPVPGLFLASAFGFAGGYAGAILAGAEAARLILKD
jgi:phytoene dehydrogenase-like protein